MVFGFIIYEAIDTTYHMLKGTYNTAINIYNWYYGIHVNTDHDDILLLKDEIRQLKDMILNASSTSAI